MQPQLKKNEDPLTKSKSFIYDNLINFHEIYIFTSRRIRKKILYKNLFRLLYKNNYSILKCLFMFVKFFKSVEKSMESFLVPNIMGTLKKFLIIKKLSKFNKIFAIYSWITEFNQFLKELFELFFK